MLPPGQNAAGDCAVITGNAGKGFTITVIGAEVLSQPKASAMVTVYVPDVEIFAFCVKAPLDHSYEFEADDDNCTEPPWQKTSGPFGVTVGAAGPGVTFTTTAVEAGEVHPFASVSVTV